MKFRDRFPKARLPLWGTLLAAVLLAGAITLVALWCQPNSLRSVLAVFRSQPLLIVLNCLPVGPSTDGHNCSSIIIANSPPKVNAIRLVKNTKNYRKNL